MGCEKLAGNNDEYLHNIALELLGEVHRSQDFQEKQALLSKVSEILVQIKGNGAKVLSLLPRIIAFQHDPFPAIRSLLLDILDDVLKMQSNQLPAILPLAAPMLEALITDSSPIVTGRVVQSASVLYQKALLHVLIAPPRSRSEPFAEGWASLQRLKERIVGSLELSAPVPLLQMRAMKFTQMLALAFSDDQDPEAAVQATDDFDASAAGSEDSVTGRFRIEAVQSSHPMLDSTELRNEGARCATRLVQALEAEGTVTTASGLVVLVHLLGELARRRTCFLPRVVDTLLSVRSNKARFLQSFGRAQVRSVEHALRATLIAILNLPGVPLIWGETFIDSLSELGAEDTARRIWRKLDPDAERKRLRSTADTSSTSSSSSSSEQQLKRTRTSSHPEAVDLAFLSQFMAKLGNGPLQLLPSSSTTAPALVDFLISNLVNLPQAPADLRERLASRETNLITNDPRLTELLRLQRHARAQSLGAQRKQAGGHGSAATDSHRNKMHVPKLAIDPASINSTSSLSLSTSAFKRMIQSYRLIGSAGQSELWVALISRYASFWPLNDPVSTTLIDSLVAQLPGSLPAISVWLTKEFLKSPPVPASSLTSLSFPLSSSSSSLQSASSQSSAAVDDDKEEPKDAVDDDKEVLKDDEIEDKGGQSDRYSELLSVFLERLPLQLNSREQTFRDFIFNLPSITPAVLATLSTQMKDYAWLSSALRTLGDLAEFRPRCTHTALACLLKHCTQADPQLRRAAIQKAEALYKGNEGMQEQIQEFAFEMLKTLSGESLKEVLTTAQTTGDKKLADNFTNQHLQLFIALCQQQPKFTLSLPAVYASIVAMPGSGKNAVLMTMRSRVGEVVGKVGIHDPVWLELLSDFPSDAKTLAISVLQVLAAGEPPALGPSPGLVSFILAHMKDDPHFVNPILAGLSKDQVIQHLPAIIEKLPLRAIENATFPLLVNRSQSNFTPSELLYQLHLLHTNKTNPVSIEKSREVIAKCLDGHHFTGSDVAGVLQRLSQSIPRSPLLLETIRTALSRFPETRRHSFNILADVMGRTNDKQATDSFIQCCEDFLTESTSVLVRDTLLQLPKDTMQAVLSKSEKLAAFFGHKQ